MICKNTLICIYKNTATNKYRRVRKAPDNNEYDKKSRENSNQSQRNYYQLRQLFQIFTSSFSRRRKRVPPRSVSPKTRLWSLSHYEVFKCVLVAAFRRRERERQGKLEGRRDRMCDRATERVKLGRISDMRLHVQRSAGSSLFGTSKNRDETYDM